ncbi:hypothetical protein KO717_00100 [Streptomyces xanthophaeus]|nr:hypothetical protein KO717_00100 [Streptomyces xanthophaeus]
MNRPGPDPLPCVPPPPANGSRSHAHRVEAGEVAVTFGPPAGGEAVAEASTRSVAGSPTRSATSRSPKPSRRYAGTSRSRSTSPAEQARYPAGVRADGRTSPIPS